jgi:hypothetical protein
VIGKARDKISKLKPKLLRVQVELNFMSSVQGWFEFAQNNNDFEISARTYYI